MKDLKDKWVLITGSASGIGRALALEFARCGSDLILADIDEPGMDQTRQKIESLSRRALCIRADVSDPASVEKLAQSAIERAGRVDVLVNNAGIAIMADTRDVTWQEWERILAINLRGPILLTHLLLPHLLERGSGHLLFTASVAGLAGVPGMAPYSVTKFGLVGFAEALRSELKRTGVGVTALCPGIVRTPLIDKIPLKGFDEKLRADLPRFLTVSPQLVARKAVRAVIRDRGRVVPCSPASQLLLVTQYLAPSLGRFILRKGYEMLDRAPAPAGGDDA